MKLGSASDNVSLVQLERYTYHPRKGHTALFWPLAQGIFGLRQRLPHGTLPTSRVCHPAFRPTEAGQSAGRCAPCERGSLPDVVTSRCGENPVGAPTGRTLAAFARDFYCSLYYSRVGSRIINLQLFACICTLCCAVWRQLDFRAHVLTKDLLRGKTRHRGKILP